MIRYRAARLLLPVCLAAVLASSMVSMRRDALAAERAMTSGSGTPMMVDSAPDQANL